MHEEWIAQAIRQEAHKLASFKKADLEEGLGMEDMHEEEFMVSKTYEVVTRESAEEGDAEDRGYEFQDEIMSRSDVVRELRRGGYVDPNGSSLNRLRWVSTEEEQDYTDGSYTTYSLHIKYMSGREVDGETWKDLLTAAGLFAGMHLSAKKDEEEYEYPENNQSRGGQQAPLEDVDPIQHLLDRDKKAASDPYTRQSGEDHITDPGYAAAMTEPPMEGNDSHRSSVTEDLTPEFSDHFGSTEDLTPEFSEHIATMETGDDKGVDNPLEKHGLKKEKPYDPSTDSRYASVLDVNKSGMPPNTTTATQDHEFELKALAKQIASMSGKITGSPNDPMKD